MTPDAPKAISRQTGKKAARKQARANDQMVDPLARKAARKLQLSSDDEVIVISDSESGDIDELLEAFNALTGTTARLQQRGRLPFRRTNLWVGFEERCERAGVRTRPPDPLPGPVKVVYRYYPDGHDDDEESSGEEREYQEWVGSMVDWCCPLCQLHRPFKTEHMLRFHLRRDHPEVKVSWSKTEAKGAAPRTRITLVIPDVDKQQLSSSDDSEEEVPRGERDVTAEHHASPRIKIREPSPDVSATPTTSRSVEPLFLPGSDDEDEFLSTTPPALPKAEEVEPVDLSREATVPKADSPETTPPETTTPGTTATPETGFSRSASSEIPRQSRLRTSVTAVTSYRGSLPPRYPSPPPPTDPLGPAAQYPYLPETTKDGHEAYSCRINGPKIYDLLNELPLDEFGIMSWAIVDREEELFEMDDVRDEDKVMLAVWNRWIMLHKTAFIFSDYIQGVKSFLDKYWQFIHRAAGWRALRAFLLMLHVNKYLSLKEVAEVLIYYEERTGMDLWYRDRSGSTEDSDGGRGDSEGK
ncbi:hypothetical protein C8Q77DRAFT_655753 [Trametes polyzona]|nr:hypothetical protein C8Q77DRAFT_655753 [Trametes polyzona]